MSLDAKTPQPEEPTFRGAAPSRVDSGILQLPSVFRFAGDVIVTSVATQSVLVFPLGAWERFEATLEADRNRRRLLDRMYYYASPERVTAEGTLMIPELLRTAAALDGGVVVIGLIDHLDIWNADRFHERLKQEPFVGFT